MRRVVHQSRYDLRALLRDRQGRYATLLLPPLLLLLLAGIGGDERARVPGLAAMAIIASSFGNLATSVVAQREAGVLTRRRATPVPAWTLIAGRAVAATVVGLFVTAVVLALGRLAFDTPLPVTALPLLAITALVGAICCCVLGYAVATAIGAAESAQPVIQALLLPLYLASGVFVPATNLPDAMHQAAGLFPVEHLVLALRDAATAAGPAWSDLSVLGLWTAAGLAVALRRFRWMPVTTA